MALFREGENATRSEIEQMSGLQTPQGTIGVFRKGKNPSLTLPTREGMQEGMQEGKQEDDLILVLDGVQNPGNLGTIIRTCDWFGVHRIICSRDTADVYNPKVVQATMGALVRVRVEYTEDLCGWLEELKRNSSEIRIYGTLLEGEDMYETLDRTYGAQRQKTAPAVLKEESPAVIVMGNEGNGISEEVRRMITHPIRIPSYPRDAETSESLNVSIATAIVLAEFRRIEN